MPRQLVFAVVLAAMLPGAPHGAFAGTVYVILSCDASIWNDVQGNQVEYCCYSNEIDFDVFSNRNAVVASVFADSFRNARVDSEGTPFKISWFMHGGGWFSTSPNTSPITTTYLINKYWGAQVDQWGDEMAYHFHHYRWDGTRWVMAPTFAETIPEFEAVMSQMIIDEGVYPVSFRAGWNYMDTTYQNYLERWIPFRLEGGSFMAEAIPYNPSFTNWRVPGDMKGWEVKHYYMKSYSQSVANAMFAAAADGRDQVVCIWSHQNEPDFAQQISDVNTRLHAAADAYPQVEFQYATAVEAMKRWQGVTDDTPPALDLSSRIQADRRVLTITTDENMFQEQPWVAARRYDDSYLRLDAVPVAAHTWETSWDPAEIDHVAVGVSDDYGNAVIREVGDGSRRWSLQSEFERDIGENIDTEANPYRVTLARQDGISLDVGEDNAQTVPLKTSYWIAQTFTPTTESITSVAFAATVQSPTTFRFELRPLLPSGFPDDNPGALLAVAEGTTATTGYATAPLSYDGLVADGRAYAIVVKLLSGSANLQIHTGNPYPGGRLLRAFSLDWISIDDFDCRFRIDGPGGETIVSQDASTSTAYLHTRGVFAAQTFELPGESLAAVAFKVASASAGDVLMAQIRHQLPDGSPDFAFDSLLASQRITLAGPGWHIVPLGPWMLENARDNRLALMLLSPQGASQDVRLAYSTDDPYAMGAMYLSDDLQSDGLQEESDLAFRLFEPMFAESGFLRMTMDAGNAVVWNGASIEGLAPAATAIAARFRFANTHGGLDSASWSTESTGPQILFAAQPPARFAQAEVQLLTHDPRVSPTLESLELHYVPAEQGAPSTWMLR